MPIITKITKQRKKNERASVFLDGKFGFGIDLENLIKLKLKVGQELTENEIQKAVEKSNYSKYFNNLLKYSSLRPRSRGEIVSWMKKKKIPQKPQDKLLKKLKKLELLNDEKFTKWWIQQRNNFRPRSKVELRSELMKKQIDRSIIDKIFKNNVVDESENAKRLLRKNLFRWNRFDQKKKKQKASNYLQRKGFKWETIKKLIDDLDNYD